MIFLWQFTLKNSVRKKLLQHEYEKKNYAENKMVIMPCMSGKNEDKR